MELTIKDTTYALRLDFSALLYLKSKHNLNAAQVLEEVANVNPVVIQQAIVAGLISHAKANKLPVAPITLEAVELALSNNVEAIGEAVIEVTRELGTVFKGVTDYAAKNALAPATAGQSSLQE